MLQVAWFKLRHKHGVKEGKREKEKRDWLVHTKSTHYSCAQMMVRKNTPRGGSLLQNGRRHKERITHSAATRFIVSMQNIPLMKYIKFFDNSGTRNNALGGANHHHRHRLLYR